MMSKINECLFNFVYLYLPMFVFFRDGATTAKGPGCDEGTNLRLRDFAVVPLMPTRDFQSKPLLNL